MIKYYNIYSLQYNFEHITCFMLSSHKLLLLPNVRNKIVSSLVYSPLCSDVPSCVKEGRATR